MEPPSLPTLNVLVRDLARPDPVRLFETESVSAALSRLRSEPIGERIVYFYVCRPDGTLTGVVPTRRLLLAEPSRPVREVMVHPVYSVGEMEKISGALEMLTARRLLALPVVDSKGRLSGIVDLSMLTGTLLDLEHKEAADEIFQMVGLHIEQEKSKRRWWLVKNRFPWLLLNVCSGIIAALISGVFEQALKAVVAVAFFIPLVLTLAESVAMQTVTISLQTIHLSRADGWRRASIARELRAGFFLGGGSSLIVALLAYFWLRLPHLVLVIAVAITAAGVFGAAFGYVIPRLVRRFQWDPKIASGPAVLALTDVAALAGYLTLAALVLN